MNARGIPVQSDEANLEKEYSYTLNEMTGERIPFGGEATQAPTQTPAPSGGDASGASATETRRAAKKTSE